MPERRTRIAHILGSLRFGGVEAWLMRLLKRMDKTRFETVFVVSELSGSEYEQEARRLGATIHLCPVSVGLFQYVRTLAGILTQQDGFDVVHSHVHAFSAVNLLVARLCGVPVRIAHSHTDRRAVEIDASGFRKIYLAITKALLPLVMTHGMAVSSAAAQDLFGRSRSGRTPIVVLPCGIDFEPFMLHTDRATVRRSFGIPEGALVIGHVGNFVPPKNHELLIRIAARVLERNPDWQLVLVGGGILQADCRAQARRLGIESRTHFLGPRSDVPAILTGLVDIFLFPSRWEGLPIALIEAQAANLPCVVSDVISPEAIANGASVTQVSLDSDLDDWVRAVEAASLMSMSDLRADMWKFDIEKSVSALQAIYTSVRADSDAKEVADISVRGTAR